MTLDSLSAHWNRRSPAAARVYLLLGALMWSSGGFFIKEIDADAITITFFRCAFAAVILAPLAKGRMLPRRPDLGVSIVLFAVMLGLFVGATKATTAANAIFLQYTAPLYIVAFGPFIVGERIRRRDAVPLTICLGGIIILFAGNAGGETLGLWLGAGSGLFYGLFLLWLRRMRYADPIAITFINCVGVAAILVFVPGWWDIDLPNIGLLVVMAAFQFAIPYVLFTRGLRDVPSAEASLIALIEPVLNPLWVVLLLGENPSVATLIGGAVIIGGLAVRYTVFRSPADEAPGLGPPVDPRPHET